MLFLSGDQEKQIIVEEKRLLNRGNESIFSEIINNTSTKYGDTTLANFISKVADAQGGGTPLNSKIITTDSKSDSPFELVFVLLAFVTSFSLWLLGAIYARFD